MGLLADAKSMLKKDPAARSLVEVMLLYPGFHALVFYRVSHWFYKHGRLFCARMVSQWGRGFTGIEIHPGATIGDGLFIDHGAGVVIGETAEIGNNVTLYHGVTLGGTGKDEGKRHPTIGDNVLIGTGCKVLGPITIGANSRIGANSVVLSCIPANATAIGIPACVVRVNGSKVARSSEELNQRDYPDVVHADIKALQQRIDEGADYDLVLAVTEELGVTDQILIKGKRSTDAVAAKFAEHPRNMMYMPIIDILKPQGRALFAEYQEKGIAPLAYEVCWNKYTPEVKECMDKVVAGGSKLWVNSLWASLCGGLDDDAAFGGDPAEVYGKLVDMGATMIQTDRPELLISYLRSRGLHN